MFTKGFFENEWNIGGTIILIIVFIFLGIGAVISSQSLNKVRECKICKNILEKDKQCKDCRVCNSKIFIGRLFVGIALGLSLVAYILFYQPYIEIYDDI